MDKNEQISLVIKAQQGDQNAMNTLFNEYYSKVYYFALKTVKDENIACDITQETFIQVLNSIKALRDPSVFASWLRTVAYSKCTRYFEKNKEILPDEDEEGNSIFDDIREDKAEYIPDEALDQAEFRKTIMTIIDELSEEQRAAVLMYYFEEMSVKEIAQLQRVSEGTVKSRLNYARKYIKSAVEGYEKKYNIALHATTILPLLFWLFAEDIKLVPLTNAAAVASNIASATGVGLNISTTGIASAAGTGINASSEVAAATGKGMNFSAAPEKELAKNISSDAARQSEKLAGEKAVSKGVKAGKDVAADAVKKGAKEVGKTVAKETVKKAGLSLGAKITAGVVAAVVTVGVAVGAVAVVKNSDKKKDDTAQTTTEAVTEAVENNSVDEEILEEPDVFETCEVGGYVTFGSYEQDNDTSNGAEPIEWLVLAKEEDKVFVISKYALDCKPYNEDSESITWENCTLKSWLNDEFYNTAFGEEEREKIETTAVVNDDNPEYGTEGGNDTNDKMFMLSRDEAETYFSSDEARECEPTTYAEEQGVWTDSSNGNCWWWLRSPGYDTLSAAVVFTYGGVCYDGVNVDRSNVAVRPAMWVSIGDIDGEVDSEVSVSDVDKQAQIDKYNRYLTEDGGYDVILEMIQYHDFDISVSEITSYLEDLDNDGIYEVLLKFVDEYGQQIYSFLDIVDDEVVCVKASCYNGGMGGWDFLYIATDNTNGEKVLFYNSHIRGGAMEGHTTNYIYSINDHTEIAEYESHYYELFYAEENAEAISQIKSETDLYKEDEDAFSCYKISGEYVSYEDYTELSERFEIIDNDTLDMKPGTYPLPIYSDAPAVDDPSDAGVSAVELDYDTIEGRWDCELTFKELMYAAGAGSSGGIGEVVEYGDFSEKIILYFEFDSDKSARCGVDEDSLMNAMPELVDAMVEYACSPEILSQNEGFDPEDYDAWFASIGMTPEEYKDNLRQELNARLDSPDAAESLAGEFSGDNYTYEIEGDTVNIYDGSRVYEDFRYRDGKLWLEGEDDIELPFIKQ